MICWLFSNWLITSWSQTCDHWTNTEVKQMLISRTNWIIIINNKSSVMGRWWVWPGITSTDGNLLETRPSILTQSSPNSHQIQQHLMTLSRVNTVTYLDRQTCRHASVAVICYIPDVRTGPSRTCHLHSQPRPIADLTVPSWREARPSSWHQTGRKVSDGKCFIISKTEINWKYWMTIFWKLRIIEDWPEL